VNRTEEWSVDERFIYYVRAPTEYYGNRLHSYGSYLTFSLRSRAGVEVDLSGTQPVVIEGRGECVRSTTVFILYCCTLGLLQLLLSVIV